jgi:hypothetical protein
MRDRLRQVAPTERSMAITGRPTARYTRRTDQKRRSVITVRKWEWQTSERNGLAAAFGAPSPVTKSEVIFTGISVVILLASITYMAIALG